MIKRLVKYSLAGLMITTVVLITAYFYLTSEGFIKQHLLPWLGKISGSEYYAKTIDVSLWHSTIKITGAKVGDTKKPFVTGDVKLSFSLMNILQGDLKVDNLILDNVKVVLRQNSDGGWDIPFGSSDAEQVAEKIRRHMKDNASRSSAQITSPDKVSATDLNEPFPVFLNVTNTIIKRGDFLLETDDGSRIIITDASFKLPKMMNDKLCQFKLTGKLSITAGSDMKVNAEYLNLDGAIRLRPNFMMQRLNLQLDMNKFSGAVNKIDLAGNKLNAIVKSYWDDAGIKIEQFHIEEDRKIQDITNINGTGMIGFSPFTIDAAINFDPVSESLVSLAWSFIHGYNAGRVKLKYNGKFHYSAGRIKSAGKFSYHHQGDALIDGVTYPLPEFSLNTVHAMEVDVKHLLLKVDNFEASLLQNDRQVIGLHIAPTSLMMEKITDQPLNATFNVDKLDLGLFQLLLPKQAEFSPKTGQLSAQLKLTGKSLNEMQLTGNIDLNDFNFTVGSKIHHNLNLHNILDLQLTDFTLIKLTDWKTTISNKKQQLALLTANKSSFNLKEQRGKLAIKLSGINYSTLRQFPLSPKTILEIGKLTPFELKLRGTSDINLKTQKMVLNNILLNVKHRSATKIDLSLVDTASFSWSKKQHQREKIKKLHLKISNMTPTVFNPFLKNSGLNFNHGWINSDILFSVSTLAEILKIKGKIAIYDLDLTMGKHRLRNLRLEKSLDIELDNYHQLDIKYFSGKALLQHQPLLEFESNGRFNLSNNSGKIRVYFNCPGPQLANCFANNIVKELAFNGNISLAVSDMFKTAIVDGNINLTKLLTDDLNLPVSASTAFKIHKTSDLVHCEKLTLNAFSNRTPLIKLAVQSSAKIIKGQAWENINFTSTVINLKLLESIMVRDPEPEEVVLRTKPYKFNLGKQFYKLNADLQGISYGQKVQGRLQATIEGNRNKIKIMPLQLTVNERMLAINGVLNSHPDGIHYKLVGKCNDMQLSPLFESLISGKMKNSKATIDKLNFDLNGNGIAGTRLWDQMNGTLEIDASAISLPNTIRDTTLGNIMFLPLDGVAKFQKFMPINWVQSSWQPSYYTDMFKTVKEFKFDHGTIRARAANRLVHIDECKFTGPLIRELQFTGWFGLGSEDTIKLRSSLDLLYLTLKLGITGSKTKPRLELVKFIPQAIGSNVIKVLDPRNIPAIFTNTKDDWYKTIWKTKNEGNKPELNEDKKRPKTKKMDKKVNKDFSRTLELLNNILK